MFHTMSKTTSRAVTQVVNDTAPYFLVHGGQEFHGLLLQASIGHRKNFVRLCFPSGQQRILGATVREGNYGMNKVYSHQYFLTDERITEEIKGQIFAKPCFTPRIDW